MSAAARKARSAVARKSPTAPTRNAMPARPVAAVADRRTTRASGPSCDRATACKCRAAAPEHREMSPGAGYVPHRRASEYKRQRGARAMAAKHARAPPDPDASGRHGRTEQQRQRRITGHRIVFLRGRKREEYQHEADPAQRQQTRLPGAIHRLERKLQHRRESTRSTGNSHSRWNSQKYRRGTVL